MTTDHVDVLARMTSRLLTRRGIAGITIGGALAYAASTPLAAKQDKHKNRKSCPIPRVKTFGCTRYKHNGCRKVRKPNGARCRQNGQCFAGFCQAPPTCQGSPSLCMSSDECCSGNCLGDVCQPGVTGNPCLAGGDCQSGECVGFHCS